MDMIKYPKIRPIGHADLSNFFRDEDDKIVVTEKIDGANFRFMINNEGKLVFGSRNTVLYENFGQFERIKNYIIQVFNDHKNIIHDLNDLKGFIFFGEATIRHTITYDYTNMPPFIGFDIYDYIHARWLPTNEMYTLFTKLGITVVPIVGLYKDVYTDIIKVPLTSCYGGMRAEGVVLRNDTKELRAKYVYPSFKEENRKVFGGNLKEFTTDTERLAYKYANNNRIDTIIFNLMLDNVPVHMAMMKELHKRVLKDIYEEHGEEIFSSHYTIDFAMFRKFVGRRCREVLEQFITNKQLEDATNGNR